MYGASVRPCVTVAQHAVLEINSLKTKYIKSAKYVTGIKALVLGKDNSMQVCLRTRPIQVHKFGPFRGTFR